MRNKLMNVFLAVGVVAIAVMLCTFDVSYSEIWQNLKNAGWWFFAVVLVWIPIYAINAWSWRVIINNGNNGRRLPFWLVMKYTISGYALNYVTPVGVLGGEPYRIMELTPYYGAAKATSSVILYAMMHIFSHFIFWAFSIGLYLIMYFNAITTGNENVESIHAHSGFTTKSTEVRGGQTRNRGTHRLTDSRTPPSEQTHVLSVAFS